MTHTIDYTKDLLDLVGEATSLEELDSVLHAVSRLQDELSRPSFAVVTMAAAIKHKRLEDPYACHTDEQDRPV